VDIDALNLSNKPQEDLKGKNLQLEKLQVLLEAKEVMQLSLEELQKKLELSKACSQMQQTSAQMHILKEDKEHSAQEVHQLKTTLEELRNQLEEPLPPQSPAGPTGGGGPVTEERARVLGGSARGPGAGERKVDSPQRRAGGVGAGAGSGRQNPG
jgi:hypothetical protein